jgi:hypothetical protein
MLVRSLLPTALLRKGEDVGCGVLRLRPKSREPATREIARANRKHPWRSEFDPVVADRKQHPLIEELRLARVRGADAMGDRRTCAYRELAVGALPPILRVIKAPTCLCAIRASSPSEEANSWAALGNTITSRLLLPRSCSHGFAAEIQSLPPEKIISGAYGVSVG